MSDVSPIRILMSDLAVGGAERVMLSLATQFSGSRNVRIVCLRDAGALRSELPVNVEYQALAPGRSRGLLLAVRAFIRLRELYAAEPTAVYISTGTGTNLLACLARLGLRSAPSLVIREACSSKNSDSKLLGWMKRLIFSEADGMIGVSDGVAAELKALARNSKPVASIPNPVDFIRLRHLAQQPDTRLASFDHPFLLTVGRLVDQKNHRLLVDAFARIASDVPEHLIIIGEGPLRKELEQRIVRLGLQTRVHLLGEVINPHPWYTRASAFVLSSDSEGYPNVLIEALAHGVKAIATDCDFGPRQILENGKFGHLVPIEDINALSDAMRAAVQSDTSFPTWDPSPFAGHEIAARYHAFIERCIHV